MKYFKLIIFILACSFNSTCLKLKEKRYNEAANRIAFNLLKIDYTSYEGKTIGYLLDKEKVNYKKFSFIEDEYSGCLNFAKFFLGHDVYLQIYCTRQPNYIQMCDGNLPRLWNIADFRKERIAKILLVQKFPYLKEVTVFSRE
jgi:hypothetical protein